MSDLQRSFARANVAKLSPELPQGFDEREEEDQVDGIKRPSLEYPSDSSSSASSTGTIVPSPSRNLFERPARSGNDRNAPLAWSEFFAEQLLFDRKIDGLEIKHHAYFTPSSGTGPLFVTHHGAGSSGLSFAIFTSEIQKLLSSAGVLSLDARGHGQTTASQDMSSQSSTTDATVVDLSLDTLGSDLAFVLQSTISRLAPKQTPPIILIGHSLGGAVVTHVAANVRQYLPAPLQVFGHIVLDVVEGSALDALSSMTTYLSTRPKAFTSIASAISWHVSSRTLRNPRSARVSVPSLVKPVSDSADHTVTLYAWITDLAATKPFWETWFTDLSSKFLSAPSAKLLILAGTDRLDKPLTIGQMQGKYQLHVIPDAGHFVHEDGPGRVANVVADFYRRNDRSTLVLPPKVDELIRLGKVKGTISAAKATPSQP